MSVATVSIALRCQLRSAETVFCSSARRKRYCMTSSAPSGMITTGRNQIMERRKRRRMDLGERNGGTPSIPWVSIVTRFNKC